jgi:hypothetical protein
MFLNQVGCEGMEFSWFRRGSVAGACVNTPDPLLLSVLVGQFGW